MGGRSLPSDGSGTERRSIFVSASTNCRHLSLILIFLVTRFCCSTLTIADNEAINPWLSITASENRLMNSGEFKILYIVRMTNISKAAERRLSTSFWLAVSVSSTNLFNAFSTCTIIPANASRKRSFSLFRGTTMAVPMLAGCFSKIT